MTKLFHLVAVGALLASVTAQEGPTARSSHPPAAQALQGSDMSIPVLIDAPARALSAPSGPLSFNALFDPALPAIAGDGAIRNTNVVTIKTTARHGLSACTIVTVSGVADTSFNGTFTITSISEFSFSYAQTGPNANSGGGALSVSGSASTAQTAVVQQALNDWQAVIQNSGTTANPYPVWVRFTQLGAAGTFCNPNRILAVTHTFMDKLTGNLLGANMVFNTGFVFYEGLADPPIDSGFTDLLTVARHELGHALGWTAPGRVANLTNFQTSAIAVNGAVRTNNVVTITTTSPHGLSAGQGVTVSGVGDNSFDGDATITAVPSSTTFTYRQLLADATSGGGTVSTGVFNAPRLNIPIVTATGLHTDFSWTPDDVMVPTIGTKRRPISLYPAASLVARAHAYTVPMQYVDPTSTGAPDGSAFSPWLNLSDACTSAVKPLLLANVTHIVPASFLCANQHTVNAARGGATVRP